MFIFGVGEILKSPNTTSFGTCEWDVKWNKGCFRLEAMQTRPMRIYGNGDYILGVHYKLYYITVPCPTVYLERIQSSQ